MKKGIALIVLIAVAGPALFCVDVRLGGGKPAGARYNEARESARLDRGFPRLTPMEALGAPPAPIVEAAPQPAPQPDPPREEESNYGLIISGAVLLVVGGLFAISGGVLWLINIDEETTNTAGILALGGLGGAGLGGLLLAVSF